MITCDTERCNEPAVGLARTGIEGRAGYHSPLYDRVYADWRAVEVPASTQQAGRDARRTEVLWCNFDPRPDLFSEVAS